jgi:GNAT superfamily N-acetyltransferase
VSEAAQSSPRAPGSDPPAQAWHVRAARPDDAQAVAAAVRELLVELDGTPSAAPAMEDAARVLIDSPSAGVVLVAQADGALVAPANAALVGVLGASWQMAIHVPGSYALIQDLWVHREWRGQAVGRGLIAALCELARERHMRRLEVGLPRESFPRFAATEAFYLGNGFTPNGPRMRRLLS